MFIALLTNACVYTTLTGNEWNSSMYYVKTLIPWACEWLMHYECWVATGAWHGGGIHHETEAEKQANKQKEELNESTNDNKKEGAREY